MFKKLLLASAALTTAAFGTPLSAMEFKQTPFPGYRTAVVMIGEIEPGDAKRFADFQATIQGKQVVMLNSPGGNIHEALVMATRIAKEGATTVVGGKGVCASACFWMFAAGRHRIAGEGAKIGVHSASDENGKETDETLTGDLKLARFSHMVGIPDHIVVKLITTPPGDIYWLNSTDLADLHVEPFEALLARPLTAQAAAPPPPLTAPGAVGPRMTKMPEVTRPPSQDAPVISDCHFGKCSKDFVTSTIRNPDSTITVNTRIENDCQGSGKPCPPDLPRQAQYKVRCSAPGFVELSGQRVPEPEADPPHASWWAKQLWVAVCDPV